MIFDATFNDKPHQIKVIEDKTGYLISIDGKESFHLDVVARVTGGYTILREGKAFDFDVESKDTEYAVLSRGNLYLVDLINQKAVKGKSKELRQKTLFSKMPGKIIKILAIVGDEVKKNQGIVIMEAMKMENELKATTSGKIKAILVKLGQAVEAGAILVQIE